MTQRFSLYADLSISENLEFVARVYGIPRPRAAARAAIERLGLQNRADQLAGEPRGGGNSVLRLAPASYPRRSSCCLTNRRPALIRRLAAISPG